MENVTVISGDRRSGKWTQAEAQAKQTGAQVLDGLIVSEEAFRLAAEAGPVILVTPQPSRMRQRWILDLLQSGSEPSVVHLCPSVGSGLTQCCGVTPFELPRTDKLTRDSTLVTCRARVG